MGETKKDAIVCYLHYMIEGIKKMDFPEGQNIYLLLEANILESKDIEDDWGSLEARKGVIDVSLVYASLNESDSKKMFCKIVPKNERVWGCRSVGGYEYDEPYVVARSKRECLLEKDKSYLLIELPNGGNLRDGVRAWDITHNIYTHHSHKNVRDDKRYVGGFPYPMEPYEFCLVMHQTRHETFEYNPNDEDELFKINKSGSLDILFATTESKEATAFVEKQKKSYSMTCDDDMYPWHLYRYSQKDKENGQPLARTYEDIYLYRFRPCPYSPQEPYVLARFKPGIDWMYD